MNRREFVTAVADRLGDLEVADAAVTAFTEAIAAKVAAGEHVTIEEFGRWSRVQRPARGIVPATYVPRFDPDPALRRAVARPRT